MTIQPVPYQGSKRRLAPQIVAEFPSQIEVLYEPFAGSAALTLFAAQRDLARRFVLGDSLPELTALWQSIVDRPEQVADRYQQLWLAPDAYVQVRARFNEQRDPVDLLYLMVRCVKNAIRFNRLGDFTQSADRRRVGTKPDRMRRQLLAASVLLRGRCEIRTGDWQHTLADAGPRDLAFLDPPYFGTSLGPDKRYHAQMTQETLVDGLVALRSRGVATVLSYDGATGAKIYGPPLPADLGLRLKQLPAGRSAQATLLGRDEQTVESLWISNWTKR